MAKIGIAVPCQDQVDSLFALDLAVAVGCHAQTFPNDEITISFHETAIISEGRNHLCKELLEAGCDHVLFIDSDMRFPLDTIGRLMQHDVPVVAANCAKRRRPISPTARTEDEHDPHKLNAVWPDREVTGLQRIAVVGTAVMLIKAEVLRSMPQPWFDTPYINDERRWVGEDVYFCARLRESDIPLYIDHDLSWHIGHVGKYVYEMKDVLAEKAMADAGMWDHVRPKIEVPPPPTIVSVA